MNKKILEFKFCTPATSHVVSIISDILSEHWFSTESDFDPQKHWQCLQILWVVTTRRGEDGDTGI